MSMNETAWTGTNGRNGFGQGHFTRCPHSRSKHNRNSATQAKRGLWQIAKARRSALRSLPTGWSRHGSAGWLPSGRHYLSVAMYAARSPASVRDSSMSGIFGCGAGKPHTIGEQAFCHCQRQQQMQSWSQGSQRISNRDRHKVVCSV